MSLYDINEDDAHFVCFETEKEGPTKIRSGESSVETENSEAKFSPLKITVYFLKDIRAVGMM